MNEYQTEAQATAIYPDAGTGSMTALTYLALGLGEAGEIQGKIKKILRDANGVIGAEDRIEIAKELGDLQWYVAVLACELGLPLSQVAQLNLAKLADRQSRGVLAGSGDER
jgi:NTP pyrophosphatase (non-canonical NTP hydrolase)